MFFGYVRKKDEKTYQGTTWQIKFKLENINQDEIYTLRLALASAAQAELQVHYSTIMLILHHFDHHYSTIESTIKEITNVNCRYALMIQARIHLCSQVE